MFEPCFQPKLPFSFCWNPLLDGVDGVRGDPAVVLPVPRHPDVAELIMRKGKREGKRVKQFSIGNVELIKCFSGSSDLQTSGIKFPNANSVEKSSNLGNFEPSNWQESTATVVVS